MSLQDKVIIVTGGTSGIGAACTRHFAGLGAKVVCASIQDPEGEALAAELDSVAYVHTDVSDESSVQNLVAQTVELHSRIDAVHCNAGVWAKGLVTDFNDADWNKVMGVNVKGVLWTAKHAIPELEKTGNGVLLVTTSVASEIGFPAHSLYCASKAALEAIVRCLATTANPATGQRDLDTLGCLKSDFGHQHFGVYAQVTRGGEIGPGDTLELT